MDEAFAYFLTNFGPPIARRDASPVDAKRQTGRLPELLLQYWTEHGFAGYADGLFWTVDPDEYADVLTQWLDPSPFKGQDDYQVIARTAFGCLFVWGTKSGGSLQINAPHGIIFPDRAAAKYVQDGRDAIAVQAFFVSLAKDHTDFADERGKPLFTRARAKLGMLEPDEMYAFVPALALGGTATLANLQKVKILEHLTLLAQLGAPRIVENPLLTS
jgi:hypothetical protein